MIKTLIMTTYLIKILLEKKQKLKAMGLMSILQKLRQQIALIIDKALIALQ